MKGPFSPLPIICEHLRAFRDIEGRILWSSLVFYLFLPLVATLILILGGVVVREKLVDILITSMSIFAALLFNLLILVYGIVRKNGGPPSSTELSDHEEKIRDFRRRYLREIISSISFAIFDAIVVVMVVLIWLSLDFLNSALLDWSVSVAVFYIVGLFLLTLFMILKRVHILLIKEL